MKIFPGSLLVSDPSLKEPFQDVIILLAEHDRNGSLGFIVNKLFSRTLRDLEEFRSAKAFPLFTGGPVCSDKLYFIHRRPDIIPSGKMISGDLFLGGDFQQAVAAINEGSITEKDICLFLGYCGWDDKGLEDEIKEGSWIISEKHFNFDIR